MTTAKIIILVIGVVIIASLAAPAVPDKELLPGFLVTVTVCGALIVFSDDLAGLARDAGNMIFQAQR